MSFFCIFLNFKIAIEEATELPQVFDVIICKTLYDNTGALDVDLSKPVRLVFTCTPTPEYTNLMVRHVPVGRDILDQR